MNVQSSSEQGLNWTRDEFIAVPSPDREKRMAIRCTDWERLKRKVSLVPQPIRWLSRIYPTLIGIGATAGFAIIPIRSSKDVSPWVIPTYACIWLSAWFMAVVCLALDRKVPSYRRSYIEEIQSEMKDIESGFEA